MKPCTGFKELHVHALRGYYGPTMWLKKLKLLFLDFRSSYSIIRSIALVYLSDIYLTFTIAMLTKGVLK